MWLLVVSLLCSPEHPIDGGVLASPRIESSLTEYSGQQDRSKLKPGETASLELRFACAIGQRTTYKEIQKLAPKGSTFSKPVWEAKETGLGNIVLMSGPINARLCFLTDKQLKQYNADIESTSGPLGLLNETGPKSTFQLRDSDRIYNAIIFMDKGVAGSKTDGLKRIEALAKILGKAKEQEYFKEFNEEALAQGWKALWHRPNGMRIEYHEPDWYRYPGSTATVNRPALNVYRE